MRRHIYSVHLVEYPATYRNVSTPLVYIREGSRYIKVYEC
jgi:hypothetical protein